MKKTLLELGLLSLVILPIVTVVSCSSTEEPTTSTLEKEAAKFIPTVTKDRGITAKIAVASIKDTDTPTNRLSALKKIAIVPTLAAGFTIKINSAKVNEKDSKSLEVEISITETLSSKTQEIFWIITGFTSNLDYAVNLFKIPGTTIGTLWTASAAAQSINEASVETKLLTLESFVNLPYAFDNNQFSLTFKTVVASGTRISVPFTLTEKATDQTVTSKEVTWIVNGFIINSTLETEVAKFQVPVVAKDKNITALEAAAKIKITDSQENKLLALNTIATIPILDDKFRMIVNSATVSKINQSAVEVSITITEISSAKTQAVVLTIISFPTRMDLLELQASMFATTKEAIKIAIGTTPNSWLNHRLNHSMTSQESKENILIADVKDFPLIDKSKYTIFIGLGTVLDATSVQVPFTISTIDEPTLSKEAVMTITGFKADPWYYLLKK